MTISVAALEPLVTALARGGVVAIATESFFGLLADAGRPDAIERLLSLKPRGSDKGMPLVLPSKEAWPNLVTNVPAAASALAHAFWPGGLSIALSHAPGVDPRLGLEGRVAVREPGTSPARELVRAYGRPLTATSANPPGEPPATTAEAVERALPEAVKDGRLTVWRDPAPGGLPSTVVVFDGDRVWIARDGAVPRAAVLDVLRKTGAMLDAFDSRG
jgi:tRNA threonylcarbamoyl adenosine modification protein (Sua5/YciO/YrdC/YwlC family)